MDTGVVFYFLAVGPAALLMFGLGFAVNQIVGSVVSARRARRAESADAADTATQAPAA